MGFEAIGRGFRPVYFVDISGRHVNALTVQIDELQNKVLRMDVRRALPVIGKSNFHFDIVFADPPYGTGWVKRLELLSERVSAIIKKNGIFVLEHSKREVVAPENWKFRYVSSKAYGETVLSFFKKDPGGEGEPE